MALLFDSMVGAQERNLRLSGDDLVLHVSSPRLLAPPSFSQLHPHVGIGGVEQWK